jgi:hypothetical protein
VTLLSDIHTYLTTNGASGPITQGYMPSTPVTITTLYQVQGGAPETPDITHPGLLVVVRAPTYADAEAKLQQIYALLHHMTNTTLSGTRYILINARSAAFILNIEETTSGLAYKMAQEYGVSRSG